MTLTPFILGGIALYVVSRFFAASGEAPAPPTPPPLPTPPPRRLRKRMLKTPAPAPEEPSPVKPAPVASRVPVITRPLIRYGHHAIRGEFSTRAALRRAIIAQEVLGPPLSERPPRF